MLRMKLLKDCCTKGFYKMSKYRVDFHIHTKFSDGQASPAEIVDAAKALGYHQIAITDHDGIDGLPEALEEGRRVDLTVIPGMELATETASGTELHILGYGMDLADKTLLAAMKELSRRRAARNTKLIAALQEMRYDISEEELRKIQPNDYIGKPVIARALIAKGYASSIPEVFQSKKMLGSETALAIKKEKLPASDAVKLIRASGGLPVLAHPIQAKKIGTPGSREFYQNMEGIVENLVSCGLGGLECFHPDQDGKQSLRFVQMAQKYDLCITRGSDFHGKDFAEAEDTAQIEETKLIGLDVK